MLRCAQAFFCWRSSIIINLWRAPPPIKKFWVRIHWRTLYGSKAVVIRETEALLKKSTFPILTTWTYLLRQRRRVVWIDRSRKTRGQGAVQICLPMDTITREPVKQALPSLPQERMAQKSGRAGRQKTAMNISQHSHIINDNYTIRLWCLFWWKLPFGRTESTMTVAYMTRWWVVGSRRLVCYRDLGR